jgi:hypothetical protein
VLAARAARPVSAATTQAISQNRPSKNHLRQPRHIFAKKIINFLLTLKITYLLFLLPAKQEPLMPAKKARPAAAQKTRYASLEEARYIDKPSESERQNAGLRGELAAAAKKWAAAQDRIDEAEGKLRIGKQTLSAINLYLAQAGERIRLAEYTIAQQSIALEDSRRGQLARARAKYLNDTGDEAAS